MEAQTGALSELMTVLSVGKLMAIAALVFFSWLMLVILQQSLIHLTLQFPRHRLLLSRVYPLVRVCVWGSVVVYSIVGIIQPHASILFAIMGSAGLAVGLAAQDPIRNMVAGVIIMINPPYRVGDMVTINGHYGEVVKLEWSVTWLHTFDDNTIMMPNAEALKNSVSNANSGALDEMVVVKFTLSEKADHGLALRLAREATACSPYAFIKKPICTLLSSRFEWGKRVQEITVKAYVVDVRLERKFASDICVRVTDAFKTAGIYPLEFEPLPAISNNS